MLADFATQRNAKLAGNYRKDNIESNFLLIDGLFSQLSDEELIETSMQSLPNTIGKFQIIGFIHFQGYEHQHDPNVFPILYKGFRDKQIVSGGKQVKYCVVKEIGKNGNKTTFARSEATVK